jgi:hypothetical protein
MGTRFEGIYEVSRLYVKCNNIQGFIKIGSGIRNFMVGGTRRHGDLIRLFSFLVKNV